MVVIGQDPGAHEAIVRRILVGEAGQRLQGFLARLGIVRSYTLINAFAYSVYGQFGGERHRDDPAIAAYRNRWLDALLVGTGVQAVIALGSLADSAFTAWKATPSGAASGLSCRKIFHPTYPEGASRGGKVTRKAAMSQMLTDWNLALDELRPRITSPDVPHLDDHYGDALLPADRAPISAEDLPAGLPAWMRSLDAWASRTGATADDKRATLVVQVPRRQRPWT